MNKLLFVLVLVFVLGYQVAIAANPVSLEPKATEVTSEIVTPASSLDKAETKLREVLTPIYASLEVFRKKEAEHFAIVRDKAKVKLGIDLAEDALEKIKPFLAPPPAPSAIPGSDPTEGLEIKKLDNPTDYGVLIGSTALASLFASAWMFYATLVLLIFFLIRLIFRMVL